MKQITVTSCGECPYLRIGFCNDEGECRLTDMEIEGLDAIHPSCPLEDAVSREEAFTVLENLVLEQSDYRRKKTYLAIQEALDALGFTSKQGKEGV